MEFNQVTRCTFSESDMNQETLLTILHQSKEDFELSLQQALNRRFITDIPLFCKSIAAVSSAIRSASEPNITIENINAIVQTLLTKGILIADLVFASKECKAFCDE